jgi:predicted TIM-barrel fold metal-dependent hydrolase
LVCIHVGGDWELGIRSVRSIPNGYVEISGSFPTEGMVEMAVREVGARRVIFGSDLPGRSLASQLAKVTGAELSAEDKELILGGNLRRLVAPIFEKKGLKL